MSRPRAISMSRNFGIEWAERLVFPLLDVAGAQSLTSTRPKIWFHSFFDGTGRRIHCQAQSESHFQFEIHQPAGAELRCCAVAAHSLAVGRATGVPLMTTRTGATVITDRQVQPVGHQSVFRTAKHGTDIGSVFA